MNNFNKTNVKWGFKVLALFIFAILTIAVCAGVWNSGYDSWVSWCAVLLFIANAGIIIKATIKLLQEQPGRDEPEKK